MPNAVRLPRLLDGNLNETARLHPTALSAELRKRACSTARLTLPDEDPRLDRMPFAELYAAKGSIGIFRVYDSEEPINGARSYTLRHAIDTLRDSVWRAQTDYSGTVGGFLTALLSYQTVARWQLGTCADQGNYKREGINYDHLDELLDELREAREGYYFTYDFSTTPWTLNFVQEAGTVDAELRPTRNLKDGSLRRTRDGQVNRLYLAVKNGNSVTTTQYDDAESQAEYGVLEGTATVDSAEVSDPAAWAAQFLRDHAAPIPSASFDGYEIVKATGEPWDALDVGKTARVAVGREGFPVSLPIEALRFENLAGDEPEKVRAELNRRLPKFSEKLAQAQKRAGGAGRRSKKNEEKIRQFETYEVKNDEMIGLVARAMGVVLDSDGHPVTDPQTGKLVYDQTSAAEIFTHLLLSYNRAELMSAINDGTGAQVSGSKVDLSASGNVLIQAINQTGGSSIKLSADVITLDGSTVASSLYGQDVTIDDLVASQIETGDLDVTGSANFQGNIAVDTINHIDVTGIGAVVDSIGPATVDSQTGGVTIPWTKLDGTAGTPVNFNIAATQYFQDQVAAAITAGQNNVQIIRGSWSNGMVSFTKSVGTPSTKTVSIVPSVVPVWGTGADANKATVAIYDYQGGESYVSTGKVATVDATSRYNAGFSAGEGQFSLAPVTLQGSAHAGITPISGAGVTPTPKTVLAATSNGLLYLRKTTGLTLKHWGTQTFYVAPTGGATSYTYDWYYVQSGGSTYYLPDGHATKYTIETQTYYDVGSSYANKTLYEAGSDITGLYNAGSTVSDTYYTKNSGNAQ